MAVVGGGEGRAELARLCEEFVARFDVVGSATTVARELGVNRHTAAGGFARPGNGRVVVAGEDVIPGGTSSSACVVRGFGVLRLPVSSG